MSNIGENNIVDIIIGNTPVDKGYLGEVLVYEKTIEYIPFVNDDIKSICCLNWGTYNEIVTVDNGDNTVTITTTKIEKLNTTARTTIWLESSEKCSIFKDLSVSFCFRCLSARGKASHRHIEHF